MIYKPEKPLIKTNPYLKNPKQRQTQFIAAVVSSTSVEGVIITPVELRGRIKRSAKRK